MNDYIYHIFEGQLHPEETDDYLQYCEEEEYYADLEQTQQEGMTWEEWQDFLEDTWDE